MSKPVNIAMIGSKFMGRAHSNAWMSVNKFFDLPRHAVMHTVAARDADETAAFAAKWGWANATTNWRRAIADDAVDLVDVATPNDVHKDQAIAALEAGKHVACEKPLAGTLDDARVMRDAAEGEAAGDAHVRLVQLPAMPRRCVRAPAGREGATRDDPSRPRAVSPGLGRARHTAALALRREQSGLGAHGDLNAHIIDMARFVTGDEVAEVSGAIEETFIRERTLVDGAGPGGIGRGRKKGGRRTGRSTVDDCVLFLARLKGGAVASFESSRLATGNQNRNTIEINGDRGSLKFDFERMNELDWWDDTLDPALRGWSRIMCTTAGAHPYVEAYWPAAHLIGYEHCFVSQAADILAVLGRRKPVVPLPDFEDAYQTQRVLHAAVVSARERRAVRMTEIK